MNILTITNWLDSYNLIAQFESLKKFWKGNRHYVIVIEDPMPEIQQLTRDFCLKYITDSDWKIDIFVPNNQNYYCGWIRQQQLKMYYSAQSVHDWVLILDAKNFLIKPIDESFFVNDTHITYLPSMRDDDWNKQIYKETAELLGVYDSIPLSSSMSPWIFNSEQVRLINDQLGISLTHWPMPTLATEFQIYWRWTYKKFNYKPSLFVSGFWSHQFLDDTSDKINLDITLARDNEDIKFWTHHRYVSQKTARLSTMNLLKEVGLSNMVINTWNELYQKKLDNKMAFRHQEFLKNRSGEDPGFDLDWYKDE